MNVSSSNNAEIIELMKELGVDVYDGYKRTVLIISALYGNMELICWCLDNGADINFRDRNVHTSFCGTGG